MYKVLNGQSGEHVDTVVFVFFLFERPPPNLYFCTIAIVRECHRQERFNERNGFLILPFFFFSLFILKDFLIKFFDYYLSTIGRIISELKCL